MSNRNYRVGCGVIPMAIFWIVFLGLLVFVLTGCVSDDPCALCVGPYDLALTSHREALQ